MAHASYRRSRAGSRRRLLCDAFQIDDDIAALTRILDPVGEEISHAIPGNEGFWRLDMFVNIVGCPGYAGIPYLVRIIKVWHGARLAADDASQRWSDAGTTRVYGVACPASLVESHLA